MIAQHETTLQQLKGMFDRLDAPTEGRNPLFQHVVEQPVDVPRDAPVFPRSVVGGYPSSDRSATDLSPPPTGPAPGAVPKDSKTLEAIQQWEEILIRPSLASAMLYVIMPVVERLIDTTSKLVAGDSTWATFAELVSELDTWGKLTIAQRVVLQDLFMWVNQQLVAEHSVIPITILSNMAAASAAYDAAGH